MMSDFVGYYIGVGKISPATYIGLHILKKVKVYIHSLVGRTIERADLCGGISATGPDRTMKQYHLRRFIFSPAFFSENFCPYILGTGEDYRLSSAVSTYWLVAGC